jgi:hypothetical protein
MDNHIHLIWQFKGENKSEETRKSFLESTAKLFKKNLVENHPLVLKNIQFYSKRSNLSFLEKEAFVN